MEGIDVATVLAATAFASGTAAVAHAAKPGDGGLAPFDPRIWNAGKVNGH